MRLDILNRGYRPGTRLLFFLVRVASGHPMPDAAKVTFYRSSYYGNPSKQLTHEAMRGPSTWTVADRELMAAYVSKINENPFCIDAHTATASRAYGDGAKVAAVLTDLDTAPIDETLRHTLRLLATLTTQGTIDQHDIAPVLAAGATPEQIEDALAVCFAFNVIARLASAFEFEQLSPKGFEAGAKYLLRRGYR
jgi:AhpD family alkylhydroperoxidase